MKNKKVDYCVKRLLISVAGFVVWMAIYPVTLMAQSTGAGCDGATRILWTDTNGQIDIWKIDSSSNRTHHAYGPYEGWYPIGLAVTCDNYTHVIWGNTNGTVSIWLVDADLNYVTSGIYGPYSGWLPASVSDARASSQDQINVVWKNTNSSISVWRVQYTTLLYYNAYGPFYGWRAVNGMSEETGKNLSDQSITDVDQKAADAMKIISINMDTTNMGTTPSSVQSQEVTVIR